VKAVQVFDSARDAAIQRFKHKPVGTHNLRALAHREELLA
jgi:hypothetical protein